MPSHLIRPFRRPRRVCARARIVSGPVTEFSIHSLTQGLMQSVRGIPQPALVAALQAASLISTHFRRLLAILLMCLGANAGQLKIWGPRWTFKPILFLVLTSR